MATLDNNKQIISSNTFQGGLVTLLPPHLLADGATPDCSNIDFSRSYGRLTKRRGYSKYCDMTGLAGCTGLYEFILAAGTIALYEVINQYIYRITTPSTREMVYINAASGLNRAVTNITGTAGAYQFSVTTTGTITSSVFYTFYGLSPDPYGLNGLSFECASSGGGGGPAYVNTFNYPIGTYPAGLPSTQNYTPAAGSHLAYLPGFTAIGDVNFTAFNNLCIAVGSGLSTLKSSGFGFDILLGTPPANAKYVKTHKDRVFIANHATGASRVSWCYINNPENWTTITGASTDAGYIDVGLGDGDVITGIESIGSVLLIFKNTSVWALFGSDPTDFKVRKISPNIGCIAPRSIVPCDSFAIFLSSLGVYSASSEGVTMLSYNIKPTVEAWTSTMTSAACAGRYHTQYWLAVNEDAAGSTNEVVYYLDYVLGVWGRYTVPNPTVFCTRRSGALISGSATVGHVILHDDTENDNAGAITAYWDTPDYDFGDFLRVKHPIDAVICAKAISAKNIVLSHKVDGASIGTTLTFLLTPSGSKDKAFFLKRSFPSTSYGRYIRFRFTNSETDAPIEIYAYSIRAAVDERQQG